MESNVKWICSCGGVVVGGYLYGEHFVEGDVDLNDVVRGNEDALGHATRVYDN